MVHPAILLITLGTIQTPQFINGFALFSIVIVNLLLTLLAAFLVAIAFESPIINIERLLLGENVRIVLPSAQKANGIMKILHMKPLDGVDKKRS